jgi:hypothetical protein
MPSTLRSRCMETVNQNGHLSSAEVAVALHWERRPIERLESCRHVVVAQAH